MRLMFFLVLLTASVACGTRRNPGVCCTSAADCESAGLPPESTCEPGFTCDRNNCIEVRCNLDQDCPSGAPACHDGFCVGCDETHPCSNPLPVCDLTANACGACTDNADCDALIGTPVCDQGACVQCASASDCGPASPVCDGGTCRACSLDSECETGACDTDGTCVPEDQIVWMSAASSIDQGTCPRTAPCRNLVYAETQAGPGRLHILMAPGLYPSRHTILTSGLFIHGTGAIITNSSTSAQAPLTISKPATLRGLTFSDSGPATSGLSALATGIVLENVTLSNVKKLAIGGTGAASVVARNLRISNSRDTTAILVSATGELTIEGGEISGGSVGVQDVAVGSKVHLKNLLIWGTSQRALDLTQSTGELDFSTIVDAGASSSAAPCAVACNANLRVTSSIIWQQSCNGTVQDAAGACTFQSSIVSNSPRPGLTNVDPLFVNQATRDYHIQSTSPAKDAVDTGPASDFEGDPRPRGAKFDIGADEAP